MSQSSGTSAYQVGDVPLPSGKEIYQALCDAIANIRSSEWHVLDPVCPECGAGIRWQSGAGFVCYRGHRLPGQDLPTR